MIIRFVQLALGAIALSSASGVAALSASDIPTDLPVSQLITRAKASLASNPQDALVYFDAAISRDPQNYLTLFQRGAAYLSLGKTTQASHDFDKVLAIKPGFEGALTQRAKIRSRQGEWKAAKEDYQAAGKTGSPDFAELEEAEGAAQLLVKAEKGRDWEECIRQASVAIAVAGLALDIRKTRARCRFERGEVVEGVSDLNHLVQMIADPTDAHLQISAMTFYSLGETEKGLTAITKCLHNDPDSKSCSKLRRRQKNLEKQLKKMHQLFEKRQYNSGVKMLVPSGEEPGLIKEVQDDIRDYRELEYIHQNAPDGLYIDLVEKACEAYIEMNNHKKAEPYCQDALARKPTSLHGLLFKAKAQIDAEEFEEAIRILDSAEEHHGQHQKVQSMKQDARIRLKQSKQKDYYKVLSVDRDADERDIKRAYRRLTIQFHPDKAAAQGYTKEEAEKKMAAINEAYEVLSDPELKARFDRGDDPNSQEQQSHPFHGSPFGGGGQQFFFQSGGGGGQQFKFQGSGGGFPFGGGGFPGGFPFG
ncbi:MAG: hypothetical protein M1820_005757 [Bogoriella megaspora]|nr:MAG: hypothetical protein M1820_005757 [Bogoriella megaspora]